MRIFLSPSTQEWNLYAGKLDNEEQWMGALAARTAAILRGWGHTVTVGGRISASSNVYAANRGTYHYYVAIHSNAGGGHGTEVWFKSGDAASLALAKAIYAKVAPITAANDRGVKGTRRFVEVRAPKATACIIEVGFHDNLTDAKEIISHVNELANAIAIGIVGGSIDAAVAAPAKPVVRRGVVKRDVEMTRYPKPSPVVKNLKAGMEVRILANNGGYYNVRRGPIGIFGRAGYVPKEFVTETTN